MVRTLGDGFYKVGVPDKLRDPVPDDAKAAAMEKEEDKQFEDTLPGIVK